jgi:hypothetical protein
VLPVPGAEIDRRELFATGGAPHAIDHEPERQVPSLLDQELHQAQRQIFAAVQFETLEVFYFRVCQ